MKFVSWNVNGLRAVCGKGFDQIFAELDADFLCLQETKLSPGVAVPEFESYHSYWNLAERKGYSGTAIYSRIEPLDVRYGTGIEIHDHEGRVITLDFGSFYLVTVYTPNSKDGLARLDYRIEWERDFRNYLVELDKQKPVIVCGDMNVAHKEIDLKNPATNHKSAGFTDEERAEFSKLLDCGFTDSFRFKYPDLTDAYTWWSYRMRAREKNVGWRIDYFVVSNRLSPKIINAGIRSDIYGSDHCPVVLETENLLQ